MDQVYQIFVDNLKKELNLSCEIKVYEMPVDYLGNNCGYCVEASEGLHEIVVNADLNTYAKLATVAHEMKHIQQCEEGRLKLVSGGYMWEGKFHSWEEFPFGEQPHEVEANHFEKTTDFVRAIYE